MRLVKKLLASNCLYRRQIHFYSSLTSNDRLSAIPNYEPYPTGFRTSITIKEYIQKYQDLPSSARMTEQQETIAGRILSLRMASRKLSFLDIASNGDQVQVLCELKYYKDEKEFYSLQQSMTRGDIIGIHGIPGKSGKGELSIIPKEISILSPCTRLLPPNHEGLKDYDLRYRQRHLDLLVNAKTREIFRTRAKVISFIRRFLEDRDFIEVETPVLSTSAGGAAALPFITQSHALNTDLYLRIAPELYLKKLIIGGMEKVFEIGKVFRNEGIDYSHNPEFTTCEFYEAYSDYYALMEMTETLLSQMIKSIHGSFKLDIPDRNSNQIVQVDFTPPFKRISIVKSLEKALGESLPDVNSYDSIPQLLDLCSRHSVKCHLPHTPARILDSLIGKFLEPQCIHPTFLCDHPISLSPLARQHRDLPGMTERFELFVGGVELCNGYSELNDPMEQRRRFDMQMKDKTNGDNEAPLKDEEYCIAMDYGLPPTGGFGIGIDRFVMMLTGATSIREVILFPTLRPEN